MHMGMNWACFDSMVGTHIKCAGPKSGVNLACIGSALSIEHAFGLHWAWIGLRLVSVWFLLIGILTIDYDKWYFKIQKMS